MDKKTLLSKILGRKELVDYSYAVLFFLISSFFLIFAIKPALSIAFSLRRESIDLVKVNDIYERNILKLVDIQANLERIRDKLGTLDSALPQKPDTKTMIENVKIAASNQGITIKSLEMSAVDFKKMTNNKDVKTVTISLQTDADYPTLSNFIQELVTEKRLKTIKRLQILKDEKNTTTSSSLHVVIQVEGYYL